MNSIMVNFTLIMLTVVTMSGCTHHSRELAQDDPSRMIEDRGEGEYVVVQFPPGKETLTEEEKSKIRLLQSNVEGRKDVAEIKVLAWSDQEYPAQGSSPSMEERKLAEQRGRVIKAFLKEDLNSKKDVDVHNMASKPGVFGEVFDSYDYRLKDALQANENMANEMGIISENKESKAVIVIRYE